MEWTTNSSEPIHSFKPEFKASNVVCSKKVNKLCEILCDRPEIMAAPEIAARAHANL